METVEPGFRTERENLICDAKGESHKRLQPRGREYRRADEGRSSYAERASQAWAKDYAAEAAEALRLANRAVELDPQNADVLEMSALPITFIGGDPPRGKEHFDRSLLINPNSPMALTTSCWAEHHFAAKELMMERLARARRLSPRDPRESMMSMTTALAHMWVHEFRESIAWHERALRQNPRAQPSLRSLVVCLVHTNQKERAAGIVKQILRIDPEFTISNWRRQRAPIYSQDNPGLQFVLDAYRAAGVPE
jgi:tetratricopeptide (TPR) repeat protein